MAKRKASDEPNPENAQSDSPSKQSKSTPQTEGESQIITAGNKLSQSEFCNRFLDEDELLFKPGPGNEDATFDISVKYSEALTDDELDECFNLIATTSRPDYEGSNWGWHPKRKKREMKELEMRYLLVRRRQSDSSRAENEETKSHIGGFMSCMLTHDSLPSVPVVYIYEIHLAAEFRKLGLGKHLMDLADLIASRAGVSKVMLTCFLSNTKALEFYQTSGFGTDECSPGERKTRNKVIKPDYVIMSKRVHEMERPGVRDAAP